MDDPQCWTSNASADGARGGGRPEEAVAGIEPDEERAGARWKREEDIPIEVWLAAAEAIL